MMDIFSTLDNPRRHGLTVPNYEEKTGKAAPYYQVFPDGKTRHFALCPECKNPVQIINLLQDRVADASGVNTPLYAKHYGKDVPGIGAHDEEAYLECDLANPAAFGGQARRKPDSKSATRILACLREFLPNIQYFIRSKVGIDLDDEGLASFLRGFKAEEGHLYRYVTLANLPYAFLYLADRQSLTGQKLAYQPGKDTPKIREAIKEKSKYFYVAGNGRILLQNWVKYPANLSIYFRNHQVTQDRGFEDRDEQFDMVLVETSGKKSEDIYVCSVPFDTTHFLNIVSREQRLHAVFDDVYGQQ
ncbi:hypothetical protein [Ottowia testudinis]|uniref:Uncharacterized protein n=1 Tax=Ottowia testudinis TaxID=2816950 RepID=A0A975H395_9BURK|nr:hypothetical protein [Ottowia testudinis]QTD45001.1 hypothetical protein J1M35_18470 [Ottowia testudinis]